MEDKQENFFEGLNPLLRDIYHEAGISTDKTAFLADVEGRYSHEQQCGEGGMKRVYAAEDHFCERKIAKAILKDDANAGNFLREIRLMARLEHPNIVPLYDVGLDEDGEPYMVMKLLGEGSPRSFSQ